MTAGGENSFTVDKGGRSGIDGSADVAIGFVNQRKPGLRQLAVAPFDLGAVVPQIGRAHV